MNCCDKNYLYLNVSKTKEIGIDSRKNQRYPKPVYVKGETVERVDTYQYLGVVFDSKLNWKENNSVLKKVNSRMHCMRKLRTFGVNSALLVTFYNTVICSIIMFGSVCWGGNISKLDRGRLDFFFFKSSSCCGKATGQCLHEKRLYRKLIQILNDPTHPVRHYFDSSLYLFSDVKIFHSCCYNRSGRFLRLRTNTNRYKASFLSSAVSVLMKFIPVVNWMCACVKTSVKDDNFLREGWGSVNLMIFI